MKFRWNNRNFQWGLTAFLVIAASMLFYYGIFHMSTLITGIKTFLRIMAPIIYGVILAFLLCPILNFLEKKMIYPVLEKRNIPLNKRKRRAIRWGCVILSLLLLLMLIYALIMMVLPQLIRSVMSIIYSFPRYVNVVEHWLNSFIEKGWGLDTNVIDMLNQYSAEAQDYLTTNILPQMQSMLKNISDGVFDLLTFFKNFLIGAIVSIYVLADKEDFVAKSKMVIFAILPSRWANLTLLAMRFTYRTFVGFISGKILDSAIIGVLCYIGTSIMNMPYAILVSVVVGVTNVIPFFGPYLGAIPCVLLILLQEPIKGLYFAIFILVLQQFDGNILGPKILGDSTGLSSFMVIVSIMIGGGLFGIPGMIIGVPVCAVVYSATCKLIQHVLYTKDMPVETQVYYNVDSVNLNTKELIPHSEPVAEERSNASQRRQGIFMAIWNTVFGILLAVWRYLKAYVIRFWKYMKKKTEEPRRKAAMYLNKLVNKASETSKRYQDKLKKLKEKIDSESKGNE